jgi:hypothetical protein
MNHNTPIKRLKSQKNMPMVHAQPPSTMHTMGHESALLTAEQNAPSVYHAAAANRRCGVIDEYRLTHGKGPHYGAMERAHQNGGAYWLYTTSPSPSCGLLQRPLLLPRPPQPILANLRTCGVFCRALQGGKQ